MNTVFPGSNFNCQIPFLEIKHEKQHIGIIASCDSRFKILIEDDQFSSKLQIYVDYLFTSGLKNQNSTNLTEIQRRERYQGRGDRECTEMEHEEGKIFEAEKSNCGNGWMNSSYNYSFESIRNKETSTILLEVKCNLI